MKKIFLIFISVISFSTNAQISNLSALASGKIQLFTAIKNQDQSIYGYFMVAKLEDVDAKNERFEYVLLDTNLNKVSNGEFVDTKFKNFSSSFLYPEKIDNQIILSKYYAKPFHQFAKFSVHRVLDIIKNEINEPFYFENGIFVNGNRPDKKLMKSLKKNKSIEFPVAAGGGFILAEQFKLKKNILLAQSIKGFDLKKSKIWEYQFNEKKERVQKLFNIIDDKHLLFTTENKSTAIVNTIHSLNPKTGKEIFKYEIENETSKYNHTYKIVALKDKYVIVGKISPYNKTGYDTDKSSGVFRIELLKNGEEISKKYFLWEDANNFLNFKNNGKLDDGYKLLAKQFFVFADGSSAFLTEKYKESANYILIRSAPKTADFVILNFDKSFNLQNVDTIEKDISKWSFTDYLYSQKIKNDRGVVFFYNDYKQDTGSKTKNWVLGIVTILDGKMNHEQIPMSSKEHFISPYIAKEGYILLREYNTDSEYDEIRLEKLNY